MTETPAVLKIAVPNKGSLAETAAQMFAEAGYHGRRDPRDLVVADPANGVEFFYLRPRDIATYVGSGALDVGITGRDLLLDAGSEAVEIEALGFGGSTFRFAGPPQRFKNVADLQDVRVATSYPGLVGEFLASNGVIAKLIKLDGAVESAVRLGVADAVADVVSTGATLRQANLEIFGPVILESEAVIITAGKAKPDSADNPRVATLLRRLQGVLVARRWVLLDYDIELSKLEAATSVAPGFESPTISPLHDPEWVAVRVMIESNAMNQIMDRLYDLGAKAMLITQIHAARL